MVNLKRGDRVKTDKVNIRKTCCRVLTSAIFLGFYKQLVWLSNEYTSKDIKKTLSNPVLSFYKSSFFLQNV